MKTVLKSDVLGTRRGFILALALISAASVVHATVTLLPDDTANYAVLYEGSGSHNLQINSSPLNGNTIFGNVGLGIENGGNPQFQFNNPAVITGNINFAAATANYNNSGGVLHGSVNAGVSQVETDLNDINALSSNLGALTGTSLSINLSGSSGSQTVNASSGTFNATYGAYVFNLTSFTFNNGNTLFIDGQGLGSNVVINVAKANVNNPHFAGAITLQGGLTPEEVIINITGGNNVTLSGGSTLQTSANNAYQYATYLDTTGNISVNSVNIFGHLFGGDSQDMQIVSGATVTAPEPASIALFVAGGIVLGAIGRRKLKQK
jgi:hypothetical protein